jgi:hypothetical protein
LDRLEQVTPSLSKPAVYDLIGSLVALMRKYVAEEISERHRPNSVSSPLVYELHLYATNRGKSEHQKTRNKVTLGEW